MGMRIFLIPLALLAVSAPNNVIGAEEAPMCLVGDLPRDSRPHDFGRPRIPLACWRSERESDGRGIHFKVFFDISPSGNTDNVRITYVDPQCAGAHIEAWLGDWRYDCSDNGRKDMRFSMTISQ